MVHYEPAIRLCVWGALWGTYIKQVLAASAARTKLVSVFVDWPAHPYVPLFERCEQSVRLRRVFDILCLLTFDHVQTRRHYSVRQAR
jgi:hypothetical protein